MGGRGKERQRDVKEVTHTVPLAFKWPFYIPTLFFHRVPSHLTATATLFCFALPTRFTVHSLSFADSKGCPTPPTCSESSSLDFNQFWHLFTQMVRF